MPEALRRACPVLGCAHVMPCDLHGRTPRIRGDHHAIYNSARWRRFRRAYLDRLPLCADCRDRGHIELARELHHLVKLADGGAIYAVENIRGLCRRCHSARTAKGE